MKSFVPLLATLSFFVLGCSPLLYSPPTQLTVAGAPATLKQGSHGVALEAGVSRYYEDTPSTSISGQYRYGLTEPGELVFEGSAVFVHTTQVAPPVAGLFSAGFKQELGTPHVSTAVRAGLGISPLGTNLGADMILSAGYENPYVVPYFNARLGISQPLHRETVLIRDTDGDQHEWHQAQGALFVSASPGAQVRFDDAYLDIAMMVGMSLAYEGSQVDKDTGASIPGGNDDETHGSVSLTFGYKL